MNTIFTTDDPSEYIDKINLDELFEKKKTHDLQVTNYYKTVLNRIHNKIKLTSRQNISEQFCNAYRSLRSFHQKQYVGCRSFAICRSGRHYI